jgi:hypothetical protein
MLRRSAELTSVIGTLFAAAPFIVLPAIIEKVLSVMSIPGIKQAATWRQVGGMTAAGTIFGFIGFCHFIETRRLRKDKIDPQEPDPSYAFPVIPPSLPETTPSVR